MAKRKSKDAISKSFFGKPFKDISIYQSQFVNSEYAIPGSVAPGMRKRKR